MIQLVIAAVLTSVTSFALMAGPAEITGRVKSFTDKVVTVENEEATLVIPREHVGVKSLKSGEIVRLALSLEQAATVKSTPKKKDDTPKK